MFLACAYTVPFLVGAWAGTVRFDERWLGNLATVVVAGVMQGGVYAMFALGLTLIFGVMRIINAAHGEMVMMGAYLTWVCFFYLGVDPLLSMVLTLPVAFLFGVAVQKLLLNAVVEPWYLAWMLPFVALFLGERGPRAEGRGPRGERRSLAPRPSSFAPTPLLGWLWLSGAVQLTDLTYLGSGAARWWPLIRAVEYGPLFALLAWDGLRQLRLRLARRAAPGTSGS